MDNLMKMAFVIHNEHYGKNVLELLRKTGIDYFTRWDKAVGKGQGTDPHMGTGSFPSTNSVLMIAFKDEAALAQLIDAIVAANAEIKRSDDKIRLFQLPLDRIV
jgi:nitrogen regulatory protein PII